MQDLWGLLLPIGTILLIIFLIWAVFIHLSKRFGKNNHHLDDSLHFRQSTDRFVSAGFAEGEAGSPGNLAETVGKRAVPQMMRLEVGQDEETYTEKSVSSQVEEIRSSRGGQGYEDVSPILWRLREQAKEQGMLVGTLMAYQGELIFLLRFRAKMLLREQEEVTREEAIRIVGDLERTGEFGEDGQFPMLQGGVVDPVVTFLLLEKGYEEDAVQYFRQSTGAGMIEAIDAVAHLQRDIDRGNTHFLEPHKQDPNVHAIQFLLESGHRILAIRYYRGCTGVSLIEAKEAVESLGRL